MPLSNPFRRAADRPTLRERAADLKAALSRTPRPQSTGTATPAPISFVDQVAQTGGTGDVLAASGIDHRDGTVSYADATGKVVRRPMSHWIGFNAQQMHGRIQAEISRRSVIEANHLPDEERVAWDAAIRCELRSDAVHALAFRHVRAFEAEQAFRSGIEPATREGGDAELLALAPLFEAAVDLYQQRIDEVEAIVASADRDGRFGMAPLGEGAEYQAWYHSAQEWRERTGVAVAEGSLGEAGDALRKIELRIAALPAASLTGLKLKARVAQRCDDIEIDWPDGLGAGLARDILAFVETAPVGRPDLTNPDALTAAILDGWKAWGVKPYGTETDEAWNRVSEQRDQLLYAAMALPATPESIPAKALACAWMEWVNTEQPGDPRDAYGPADQIVFDIHAAITKGHTFTGTPRSDESYSYLVDRIDFASATMQELLIVRNIAERIGSAAYAHAWGPQCRRRLNAYGAPEYNAAGILVQSLGDTLTAVESAAEEEAKRRAPGEDDRDTRLSMLAHTIIDNGDPEETEAFARELLAHAAAERARG